MKIRALTFVFIAALLAGVMLVGVAAGQEDAGPAVVLAPIPAVAPPTIAAPVPAVVATPGGGYSADRHGLIFSGDYSWDGRERVLIIREGFGRIPPPPSRRGRRSWR